MLQTLSHGFIAQGSDEENRFIVNQDFAVHATVYFTKLFPP
jgi:hypothetical protein